MNTIVSVYRIEFSSVPLRFIEREVAVKFFLWKFNAHRVAPENFFDVPRGAKANSGLHFGVELGAVPP